VCRVFLCGLYPAPLKLSEHQIIYEQHLEKSRPVRTIDVQATFDIDIPKNAFEFKK